MTNSPSITQQTLKKPAWRRHKVALLLAAAAAMLLMRAQRAHAFLFDIVLDPVALVENILKVVELASQIDNTVQQVENEVKSLEHLNLNFTPNVQAIVSGIEGQLDSSLYNSTSPGNQLDTRYPADMSTITWSQYQSDQSTWVDQQRQSLAENRQIEDQVYQDMDNTTQQVQDIVDASNSASGETAAVQAHNDLLAVESAELAKLQALKLARARLRTENLAQQQSEVSFAEAERQRVRSGWDNPAPPTVDVVDPFQN
jgi:P-type conjugative transfer protein TrbJ